MDPNTIAPHSVDSIIEVPQTHREPQHHIGAAIRTDLVSFLTKAKMNVIIDGRSERRNGRPGDCGILNRLTYYDSWPEYIADMKSPEKYMDILFVNGYQLFIMLRFVSSEKFMMNLKYIISVSWNLQIRLRHVF